MSTIREPLNRFLRGLIRWGFPVAYLCALLAGIAGIVAPPTSFSEATADTLTAVWGWVIVSGAVPGLIGSLVQRPGVEMLGGPTLLVGVLSYGVVLLVRQWSAPGIANSGTVAAWLVITLSVMSLARFSWTLLETRAARARRLGVA